MSVKIIWNTDIVNETLLKMRQGADVPMECFFDRNPELKAPNILFQLTLEEEQEFIKCSSDIVYFVQKYCRFLTDKGRTTVPLRKFQEEILSTIGEEFWLNEIEDVAPKVRNFILMSARQSGKCLFNPSGVIKNTITGQIYKINLNDLYILVSKHLNKNLKQKIIYKVKKTLYKLYQYLS